MAYLEKDVNILFLYNHDIKLSKNSFHSIKQAIHKNIETIQKNLEKDFAIFNKSQILFKHSLKHLSITSRGWTLP